MKNGVNMFIVIGMLFLLMLFIFKFYNKEKFYIDDKEKTQENIQKEEITDDIKGDQESINTNELMGDYIVSNKELELMKENGVEFIELVHGYDLEGKHSGKIEEAKKYATISMESFLQGAFIETKQPILSSGFNERKVIKVEPVEYKMSGENIMWEFMAYSIHLNKDREQIKTESNIINLMFIIENNEWKIGEYSTTQYRG